MNEHFDYVIIGGGPSGLTLAHCLSSINNLKILIIDKEPNLGGCHRVKRVPFKQEMLFTEHGPRIYSSSYINTAMILEKMGKNFNEIFTPYNFNFSTIGNETIFSTLNLYEIFILALFYIPLIFYNEYGNNISMKDFLYKYQFSKQSIDLIDRLCRITDGADITRYTLNEFFNLLNQNTFNKFYQPKLPNDIGLFFHWEKFLLSKGVKIMKNTEVQSLNLDLSNNSINYLKIKNNTNNIYSTNFILAIPPDNFTKIISYPQNSLIETEKIKNCFGDFNSLKKWSKDTEYINYISITFHWDKSLDLPKIYGFSKTSWGLVFIILSDYMTFSEFSSKTVISVAVSNGDLKSDRILKTANECNENELIEEVFFQLSKSFPNSLPNYTAAILSPNNIKNNNKWINKDSAYISSSLNPRVLNFQGSITNLYNLGSHNGKSFYKFTSMESAVTNSLYLAHHLYPHLQKSFPINKKLELNDLLKAFIILIIIFAVK